MSKKEKVIYTSNKQKVIHFVMNGLEGEYDNDPDDNGGETFWGVTKVAYADCMGTPVQDTEWPVLDFNKDIAYKVYEFFWNKMECDLLPKDMQLLVFAFGFNAGYYKATKFMQGALGLKSDGIIGTMTKAGYSALNEMDHQETKIKFAEYCIKHYFGCEDFGKFGRGWVNRLIKTLVM